VSFFLQAGGGTSPLIGNFLFLGLMFAVFYFLIIRPQQKRSKEHKQLLSDLSKGDRVVTSGGIFGTVVGVQDEVVVLRVDENTKIEVVKENISGKVQS